MRVGGVEKGAGEGLPRGQEQRGGSEWRKGVGGEGEGRCNQYKCVQSGGGGVWGGGGGEAGGAEGPHGGV